MTVDNGGCSVDSGHGGISGSHCSTKTHHPCHIICHRRWEAIFTKKKSNLAMQYVGRRKTEELLQHPWNEISSGLVGCFQK